MRCERPRGKSSSCLAAPCNPTPNPSHPDLAPQLPSHTRGHFQYACRPPACAPYPSLFAMGGRAPKISLPLMCCDDRESSLPSSPRIPCKSCPTLAPSPRPSGMVCVRHPRNLSGPFLCPFSPHHVHTLLNLLLHAIRLCQGHTSTAGRAPAMS